MGGGNPSPAFYMGKEGVLSIDRRQGDKDRRAETCVNHETNTKDLTSLKSAVTTIKWVISVGMPVATLIVGAYIGEMQTDIKKALELIQTDIKAVRETVQTHAVDQAIVKEQMSRTRADLEEVKTKMKDLHSK